MVNFEGKEKREASINACLKQYGIKDLEEAKQICLDAGIDVEYMYAFITRKSEKAYVILRVADNDAATTVLLDNGVELLDEATFHELM